MRKIQLLLTGLTLLFAVSCTDNSGEFGKYIYTDTQLNTAIKQVIIMSTDTANAHLCIPESDTLGFNNYSDGDYQIQLPTSILPVFEVAGNEIYQDSLMIAINEVAERCGSEIATYVKISAAAMAIDAPDSLLLGGENAIVSYYSNYRYNSFLTAISAAVNKNFSVVKVGDQTVKELYDKLLQDYYQSEGPAINLNIYSYISEQMGASIITEMKLEEINIRNDETHRGSEKGIVYLVLKNYDLQ